MAVAMPSAQRQRSQQAAFRHRGGRAVANHEMVEQAHVHQGQRLAQARGEGAVGGAGFGIPAGMVMALIYHA